MITIYHNPRCSKSRAGVETLNNSGKEFKIIKYLETPLTQKELTDIISKLSIEPIALIRTNEKIWKENYKGKSLTNNELIQIMIKNPKLIERPIVINEKNAVIGRPTENIKSII